MDSVKRTILAALFLMVFPGMGWAGTNIGLWFQQRENAPEILSIHVETVQQKFALGAYGCPMAAVTLNARVTKVIRSTSHLKVGDTIVIHYNRRPQLLPLFPCGPISTPVPRHGIDCAGYLSPRKDGVYSPFVDNYDAFVTQHNAGLQEEPSPLWWLMVEHPILTTILMTTAIVFGVRFVRRRTLAKSATISQ